MPKDERNEPQAAGYDSLGPALHSGGVQEPGGPVPPYEGRQTEMKDTFDEHMRKVGTAGGGYGEGRIVSPEEEAGVASTDTEPHAPHGSGVSKSKQGNERALGKSEEERRKDREEAGISPPKPAT